MKFNFVLIILVLLGVLVNSCEKDDLEDNENVFGEYNPTPYNLISPNGFPQIIIPDSNTITEEGVELGKRLFYDPILSEGEIQSCASCHSQDFSFSDNGLKFSKGVDGIEGGRNTMASFNMAWQTNFFWDGRAATLEQQILGPVENPVEMNESWEDNEVKLRNDTLYQRLFYKSFGIETNTIDRYYTAKAIAQFLRTVVSGNSKFDKYSNYTSSLTDSEMRGLEFFYNEKGDCFHCHATALFTDGMFHNNALDAMFADNGLGDITNDPNNYGKFKTPTLRNIELSAPYMHDGRFSTLEEVIDFYSEGQQYSSTVDPLLWRAREGGAHFTTQEKQDLLAFLKTLTDTEFINNHEFSSPF